MDDSRSQWGTNLSTARLIRGYATQTALAEALGLTRQAVSQWETGRGVPDDENKLKVARLLGVPASVLFPLENRVAS